MNVTIAILNYNGSAMLRRYLPTVLQSAGAGASVVVADNASTDDSREVMRVEFPSVRLITLDRNYGFAEGYNRTFDALRLDDADLFVLLNSDVRCTQGWLQPIVSYMEQHSDVAACQPKLLSDARPTHFEYAGACGGYLDRYGYPYCRGRVFQTVEADRGQYDTPALVDWATGACLCIRAADYRAAAGLDPRYFAHNEEIDLCWRLRSAGRHIACVPQSAVYHLGGGTLPQGNPRKTYLNFRNNLTMLYKCLPDAERRHVLRVRRWLDMLAALQMLLTGKPAEARAVLRARHDFHAWRHQFDHDHATLPHTTLRPLCLLWQYYIRGRKTFSTLPASLH